MVEDADDFGHEMRVAGVLRRSNVSEVSHGGTYVDPVTSKPRQFDFRFRIRASSPKRCLSFAAECKNVAPDNPVIVCGRRRERKESFHDVIGRLTALNYPTTTRATEETPYKVDRFVGKSVIRGKPSRQGESDIYDKWAQAVSSARDLIKDAVSSCSTGSVAYAVVIPIVVLPADSLWIAEYDIEGVLTAPPEPVDECHYYIGHTNTDLECRPVTISHLHFFTLSGLERFLHEFDGYSLQWDWWIPLEVRKYDPA